MTTTTPRKRRRKTAEPDLGSSTSSIDAAQFRATAASESVLPELTTNTEAAPLPRMEPKPPFVLMWHVSQWIVMRGELVPALAPRRLQPGVSRIYMQGDRLNISDFKVHTESKGWRMIPYSWAPDGRSYMRVTEVDPTGSGRSVRRRHHSQWETLYAGTDRVGRDEEGYVAWLRHLVDSKRIPECPIVIAYGMRERALVHMERLQRQVAQGITSNKENLARAQVTLEVLERYIAKAEAEAPPVASSEVVIDVDGVA